MTTSWKVEPGGEPRKETSGKTAGRGAQGELSLRCQGDAWRAVGASICGQCLQRGAEGADSFKCRAAERETAWPSAGSKVTRLLRHKPSLSLDQLKPGWQAILTSLRVLTRVISWFPKNWVWHCWYHFYSLTWQRTKTIHRVKPREPSAHRALVLNGKTQNHIYEPKVLRF